MAERPDDIADREEIAHAALKHGIFEPAVRHVSEGHAKTPKHLARREQPALRVAKPHAVFVGTLVQRSPDQHGHAHILREPRTLILRAKIAVRQKKPVDLLAFELFDNFQPIILIIEQPFLVDIVNINEGNA